MRRIIITALIMTFPMSSIAGEVISNERAKELGIKYFDEPNRKNAIENHAFKAAADKVTLINNHISFDIPGNIVTMENMVELDKASYNASSPKTIPAIVPSDTGIKFMTTDDRTVGGMGTFPKAGIEQVVELWDEQKKDTEFKKVIAKDNGKGMYPDGTMKESAKLSAKERLIYLLHIATFSCEPRAGVAEYEAAMEQVSVNGLNGWMIQNAPFGYESCLDRMLPAMVVENNELYITFFGRGQQESKELFEAIKGSIKPIAQ